MDSKNEDSLWLEQLQQDSENTENTEPPEKKCKLENDDDDELKVENIQNVMQSMDKSNVENIVSKLYNVEFPSINDKIEGVNLFKISSQLKDFIHLGQKQRFESRNFLNIFMGFLYDEQSTVIDSSFFPLSDDKLNETFEDAELNISYTPAILQTCRSIPFDYNNLDYLFIIMCKATVEFNERTQKDEIRMDIMNLRNIQARIKAILMSSCRKIVNLRNTWKEILSNKSDKENAANIQKYSYIAELKKSELKGSLDKIYKHRLFDTFMENSKEIDIGTLYVTPTKGYTKKNNSFVCLELLDVDNKTYLSKCTLKPGDSDVRMFVGIKKFTICYTENNNCYLKGYARWGLKLPN